MKINDKPAPSDSVSFADLVKQQKSNEAMEIVVVRDGQEETLKAAQMPQTVQEAPVGGRGLPGFAGPKRLPQFIAPLGNGGQAMSQSSEPPVNGVRITQRTFGIPVITLPKA